MLTDISIPVYRFLDDSSVPASVSSLCVGPVVETVVMARPTGDCFTLRKSWKTPERLSLWGNNCYRDPVTAIFEDEILPGFSKIFLDIYK